MKHIIDSLLNKTTMYRLALYYLIATLVLAVVLGAVGALPFGPVAIISTTLELLIVCWFTNLLFSRLFRIPVNEESAIITALILALISGPVSIFSDPLRAGYIAVAGVVAIASKFLIAPRKQHVFNPAAFGIFVSGVAFHEFSTWWVGSAPLLPLVALGGLLILRKTQRFRMVGIFLASFIVFLIGFSLIHGLSFGMTLQSMKFIFIQTEIIFFAVVMFTEPLTSPKVFGLRVGYALVVAFFFLPQLTIFGISFSPELALLLGNVFTYMVGPSYKLVMKLREKREIGTDILSFTFDLPKKFDYRAGQYMEWTLPLPKSDSRGNRRYFTIASSPTEEQLVIAARFYDHPSAYKNVMARMKPGDRIVASDLSGDFVLPRDPKAPLVLIAGGIGITPFRSMIQYMMDTGQHRPVVLMYSNYGADEIVFDDVFKVASATMGLKMVYTLTDGDRVPSGWRGKRGFIDAKMIASEVPDYADRHFYLSGSLGMVEQMKKHLRELSIRPSMIRTDFFPGYAT